MAFSPLTSLAGISVSGTTVDGFGAALHGLVTQVAAQVVVNGTGTGQFLVQGSIDGTTWQTIIPTSTYTANRIVGGSTFGLVSYVRAQLVSHGSTNDVTIHLIGK
jgi:hypothetical protein